MFNRLFRKRPPENLSKDEYWKKWELFKLFDKLHEAEKLLADIVGDDSDTLLALFKSQFVEELYEIEGDNVTDFTKMWEWFTPTKEWDILVGQKGKKIGAEIFRITDNWKRTQCFLPGTKVYFSGLHGVVLDKGNDDDEYGLIRWDSEKEEDVNDWRGEFGNFKKAGGQVINQDYIFKFINEDGRIKKACR